MKPLSILKTATQAQIDLLSIQQILAICGTGKLTDNSEAASELREYLLGATPENLKKYVSECLDKGFENSGLVLQDVVNELGRRLGYNVENGLYRGKSNAVGYDGIWTWEENETIVEVKTTDYININLDLYVHYRQKLVDAGKVKKNSAILIVLGREDTGGLEAQIRGSKYGDTIRVIGVEALAKLMDVKLAGDLDTIKLIHEIMVPFDNIRLDKIIDIVFSVSKNAQEDREEELVEGVIDDENNVQSDEKNHKTSPTEVAALRAKIMESLKNKYGSMVKVSRALYFTPDQKVRTVITISKKYEGKVPCWWYSYHSDWDDFLSKGESAFFVIGCNGTDAAYAIPYEWMHQRTDFLHKTEGDGKTHWHIYPFLNQSGAMAIQLRNKKIEEIEKFKINI